MIRSGRALSLFLLLAAACAPGEPKSPEEFSHALARWLQGADAGGILNLVDMRYQDEVGGQGRLGDDLRQLFTVYGPLRLRFEKLVEDGDICTGTVRLKGRGLTFHGPWKLSLIPGPQGPLIGSGVLPELRLVLNTLRERRLALETGVVERLADVVSHTYHDRNGGRDELVSRLRGELLASYGMAVIYRDLDITVEATSASARVKLLLVRHTGPDKVIEENREETLSLVREGSSFRLAGGLD
ncbi:MAG: hypothetical protein GYA21_03915 [Myxococcales bacterium]|nr:hypothetical protein [Myxococcales bacterium]